MLDNVLDLIDTQSLNVGENKGHETEVDVTEFSASECLSRFCSMAVSGERVQVNGYLDEPHFALDGVHLEDFSCKEEESSTMGYEGFGIIPSRKFALGEVFFTFRGKNDTEIVYKTSSHYIKYTTSNSNTFRSAFRTGYVGYQFLIESVPIDFIQEILKEDYCNHGKHCSFYYDSFSQLGIIG